VQAFTKAAELNPKDSSAAYNVAVSYYNSRYYSEALKWYREALQRNPNSTNKEEILRMIEQLSKR
jgi:tetratricopeptide (TPR) repeat protein